MFIFEEKNVHSYGSLALALQRLFCRMEFSKGMMDTREVTKSLGWGFSQLNQEQDVYEVFEFLCDKLEEQMKVLCIG